MKQKIELEIKDFLQNLLDKNVDLDQSLFDEGLVDSFNIIKLITFLEKKYNIELEAISVYNKDTINQIAKHVKYEKS